MREVSSKMNLTDCANPNYEDAVSVVSRIHTVTYRYIQLQYNCYIDVLSHYIYIHLIYYMYIKPVHFD